MATNSMVPYSNPGGRNQTSPTSMAAPATPLALPTPTPTNPAAAAQANPLVPTATGVPIAATMPAITGVPATTTTGTQPGAPMAPLAVNDPSGTFYQQMNDIYGATGDQMYNLLQSIGGVQSTTLQDYIKSLQPQFAKAGANLQASLGAGGVGANSSVAALGEANLQAQEQGLIAEESANLLQGGQQLEANILGGLAPTAEEQVASEASAGWNTFAQILGGAGSLASDVLGLGSITGGLGSLFKGFGGKGGSSVPNTTSQYQRET